MGTEGGDRGGWKGLLAAAPYTQLCRCRKLAPDKLILGMCCMDGVHTAAAALKTQRQHRGSKAPGQQPWCSGVCVCTSLSPARLCWCAPGGPIHAFLTPSSPCTLCRDAPYAIKPTQTDEHCTCAACDAAQRRPGVAMRPKINAKQAACGRPVQSAGPGLGLLPGLPGLLGPGWTRPCSSRRSWCRVSKHGVGVEVSG